MHLVFYMLIRAHIKYSDKTQSYEKTTVPINQPGIEHIYDIK